MPNVFSPFTQLIPNFELGFNIFIVSDQRDDEIPSFFQELQENSDCYMGTPMIAIWHK